MNEKNSARSPDFFEQLKKNRNHKKDLIPNKKELMNYAKESNPVINSIRTIKRVKEGVIKNFISGDNYALSYREFLPTTSEEQSIQDDKSKQSNELIICIHGLHSHGEKFVLLADKFAKYGFPTFAPDLRGHGLSFLNKEDYGNIDSYQTWISDMEYFVEFIHKAYPEYQIHLIGESMGGAVVSHLAAILQERIQSVILLSPALKPWTSVQVGLIAQALSFMRKNEKIRENRGDPSVISNSEIYIEYEKNDKLRLQFVAPKYYEEVLKMIKALKKIDFKKIKFPPTVIFYGENDKLIDFDGCKTLIYLLKHKRKALHYIPRAYHELLTDLEAVRYGIYKKITHWIISYSSFHYT